MIDPEQLARDRGRIPDVLAESNVNVALAESAETGQVDGTTFCPKKLATVHRTPDIITGGRINY